MELGFRVWSSLGYDGGDGIWLGFSFYGLGVMDWRNWAGNRVFLLLPSPPLPVVEKARFHPNGFLFENTNKIKYTYNKIESFQTALNQQDELI